MDQGTRGTRAKPGGTSKKQAPGFDFGTQPGMAWIFEMVFSTGSALAQQPVEIRYRKKNRAPR
jgi:hypothetical protein